MSPILAQHTFLRATVTNFLFFMSLNAFVLLPLHIHRLGGTEVEIGLVMGLYSATGIVCQPLVGPWADVLGRRPFMRVGVSLVVGGGLLATVANAIPWFAAVRLLQGVGFAVFFVGAFSYVVDLVPESRRGWALGIYGVSGLAATAVSPLGGEWIVRWLGFRALFVVSAAFAVAAAALVWNVVERPRATGQPPRSAEWVFVRPHELRHWHMVVTAFFGLGAGTIFAFLPTFAEGLGVRTLGLFYTAYAAAAMGVRIFAGRLIDTRGRRAVVVPSMFAQMAAGALLAAVGFLVSRTSHVPVVPFLFLVGALSGGAHGFLYPGLAALVTDQTPPARRGAVIGVFSAVFLAGNAAGAFAFGYVAHGLGYGPMWAVLTGLLLIGAALSLRLPGPGTAR